MNWGSRMYWSHFDLEKNLSIFYERRVSKLSLGVYQERKVISILWSLFRKI